jgi:hypothetical protein
MTTRRWPSTPSGHVPAHWPDSSHFMSFHLVCSSASFIILVIAPMPVTNSASSSRLFVYDSDKEVEQLLQEAKVEAKQKLIDYKPNQRGQLVGNIVTLGTR